MKKFQYENRFGGYVECESKEDGKFKVPIVDVRDGERARINSMVKDSNGNNSKFVPAKYGYGRFGQQKY
jgi:hypothetical protein